MFIADEIQTGFCRTGDWFASEHEGVEPDLITTAKGIAGGLPLAGVTGRAEIMDAVHAGGLGGTYGGNPVACAAALASIETMRELDLVAAPRRDRGGHGAGAARRWRPKHPTIGEVRGRGAMIAVEIVTPGTTRPGRGDQPAAVSKACHAAGLLTLTCGTYGNVLRFLPPLVMPPETLQRGPGHPGGSVRDRVAPEVRGGGRVNSVRVRVRVAAAGAGAGLRGGSRKPASSADTTSSPCTRRSPSGTRG